MEGVKQTEFKVLNILGDILCASWRMVKRKSRTTNFEIYLVITHKLACNEKLYSIVVK